VNALNIYFLGLALILLSWTTLHGVWPSQVLSFTAGLISLFNLLDFILVPHDLHTYTSLPAAAALAVLSPAIMCARPEWGYGAPPPGSNAQDSIVRRWFFKRFAADQPRPLRYGGAVLLVAVATILRYALDRSFGAGSTYATFYPVTLLVAVLGGLGPGILATLLSAAAAAYYFLDPHGIGVANPGDAIGLGIFALTGIAVSVVAQTLNRFHQRTEEKLLGVSLYSRSLLEAALDPMVTISPEGKITDLNHATEEATGVSRARLIGTDFADYFTEPEKARAGYRQAFDQGYVNDYPLAIRHVSSKVADVLYNASPYRDESGAVAGVFATARDITERKRVEREGSLYRQRLEDAVAERTAEILTTNKRLESANQELETFAYSVSHDLRSPLRAVDGFSRILLEDYAPKLDTEGQRIVTVVREGTKKMAQMIDDILAFSRAGRQEIAPGAIDMEELARAALKDLEPALAGRNVKVDIKPLPPSYGDAPMIRRVWTNLLDNAIKFTRPKPEGLIEVGAQAKEGETIYHVKDNGVGFDTRYIGKLFGVFQRLHSQEEFPGTGIGLAIVKRIVARHGGRVWAESQVGQGATISFALPTGDKS
jgi:PAS domain S-box-containing protein